MQPVTCLYRNSIDISTLVIDTKDISAILTKLDSIIVVTQEVTYSHGDTVLPVEYIDNGESGALA